MKKFFSIARRVLPLVLLISQTALGGVNELGSAARFVMAEQACNVAQAAAEQPWMVEMKRAIEKGDKRAAGYAGCRFIRDGGVACLEAAQAVWPEMYANAKRVHPPLCVYEAR